MPTGERRWNHNLHYHRLVLRAVPDCARSALDVGTGDGLLARDLHQVVPDVTAIDVDAAVLERARPLDPGVHWVHGDALSHDFGQRFDVVASIAVLHHFPDAAAALARLADLVEPGGTLVVVGLARSTLRDLPWDAVGIVADAVLRRRKGFWEHTAPIVWPPPLTYPQVRAAAKAVLPGVGWRRLVLWRYALVWHRPS